MAVAARAGFVLLAVEPMFDDLRGHALQALPLAGRSVKKPKAG
jgi:hypothetical protein